MDKRDYIIRHAEISDSNEIAYVNMKAWQESYSNIFPEQYLSDLKLENFVRPNLTGHDINNKQTLIALSNRKIIGFCTFGQARKFECLNNILYGEIYALYILKSHQNVGVGKKLLNNAFVYLKRSGYIRVIIWTLRDNKIAQNVYIHLGYIKTSWHKNFVINNHQYPEVAFYRNL